MKWLKRLILGKKSHKKVVINSAVDMDYGCVEHNGEVNTCYNCMFKDNGCRHKFTKKIK